MLRRGVVGKLRRWPRTIDVFLTLYRWNRDIEGILKESGLKVDKISRYHFGTTYWIEATPRQQAPTG